MVSRILGSKLTYWEISAQNIFSRHGMCFVEKGRAIEYVLLQQLRVASFDDNNYVIE